MSWLVRLAYRAAARALALCARFAHPTLRGAAVLVRSGDHLLVARTSYQSWVTVPGGRIGRGEPAHVAARRELREEVGLDAPPDALEELGELRVEHSNVLDCVRLFTWRLPAGERPAPRIDGREIVWAGWLAVEEVRGLRLWPPLRALLDGAEPKPPDAAGAEPTD